MAYALVGTAGAATTAATSVTPIWPVSETRAVGNLLVCWAANISGGSATTASAGWSTAITVGTAVAIFYKVATGGDAAPTVTNGGAGTVLASVAEFSGNAASAPLDQVKGATAATSPATATNPSVDAASGELLLYVSHSIKTGGGNTNTLTNALNNGATANDVVNVGANTATEHHAWGYGITTAHAVADSDVFSVAITTSISTMEVAIASFKLPAVIATVSSTRTLLGVGT